VVGFVGLGSNIGDREEHLREALAAMERRGILPVALSSLWETEPVGGAGPGWFLNMVARIETSLGPEAVLEALLAIEEGRGRVRNRANAPRELDLDLLTLGGLTRDGPDLILPHPRMTSRKFVLAPLAEIAPEFEGALAKVDDPHEVRNAGKLVYSRAL